MAQSLTLPLHTVRTDRQRAQQMRIISETKYIINLVESLSIAKWSCAKENYAFATFCANVFRFVSYCFCFFLFLFLKDEQMTHNTAVETFINGKVVERNSFCSQREKSQATALIHNQLPLFAWWIWLSEIFAHW